MTLEDVLVNAKYQMADDGLLDQTDVCDHIFASAGSNYSRTEPCNYYNRLIVAPDKINFDTMIEGVNKIRAALGMECLTDGAFNRWYYETWWLNAADPNYRIDDSPKKLFPLVYDMYTVAMSAQDYADINGCTLESVIIAAANGYLPDHKLARDLRRTVFLMKGANYQMLNLITLKNIAKALVDEYPNTAKQYPLYYCVEPRYVDYGTYGIQHIELIATVVVETKTGKTSYHSYVIWGVEGGYTPIEQLTTAKGLRMYKCKTPRAVKQYLDKTWR